jgi:hypothetical protein
VDLALVQPPAPKPIPTSPIYNNYDPAGNHLKPESLAAMQAYTQENPEPKNAQVLKGWNTQQITAYMTAQVSGGLKVDCSYCHNINNFADDGNDKKVKARAMMLMSGDLNRSFISKLPVPTRRTKSGLPDYLCHLPQRATGTHQGHVPSRDPKYAAQQLPFAT